MRTVARKPAKKRPRQQPARRTSQRGETYTPRRLAQFLLENAVDAPDYAAARREVRKLGLNPDEIRHTPPPRS
jgi:hypothetical protein